LPQTNMMATDVAPLTQVESTIAKYAMGFCQSRTRIRRKTCTNQSVFGPSRGKKNKGNEGTYRNPARASGTFDTKIGKTDWQESTAQCQQWDAPQPSRKKEKKVL
jgi:hypothetical protein